MATGRATFLGARPGYRLADLHSMEDQTMMSVQRQREVENEAMPPPHKSMVAGVGDSGVGSFQPTPAQTGELGPQTPPSDTPEKSRER